MSRSGWLTRFRSHSNSSMVTPPGSGTQAMTPGNLLAATRYLEQLAHLSPCGETARYLTDLCAATHHITSEHAKHAVGDWLTAPAARFGMGLTAFEAAAFDEAGYRGPACLAELKVLSAEDFKGLKQMTVHET